LDKFGEEFVTPAGGGRLDFFGILEISAERFCRPLDFFFLVLATAFCPTKFLCRPSLVDQGLGQPSPPTESRRLKGYL
jgi:hypothetical protein